MNRPYKLICAESDLMTVPVPYRLCYVSKIGINTDYDKDHHTWQEQLSALWSDDHSQSLSSA